MQFNTWLKQFNHWSRIVSFTTVLLLAACGGEGQKGQGYQEPGNGNNGGSGGGASETSVSFVPLMVFEKFADFSGYDSDGLYAGDSRPGLLVYKYISPVNSNNLNSMTPSGPDQYSLTVDGVEIDEFESFPTLQRVIGTNVYLRTALVFDISDSTNNTDFDALIAEAKDYVAAVQAHSDRTISQQEFVVWAFGTDTVETTNGFTNSVSDLNTALDQVVALRNAVALGTNSTLHRMIVEAVGRYEDLPAIDFNTPDDNDLDDYSYADGIFLTQLVLFSSGPDTTAEMTQELMIKAIQSQNFVKLATGGSAASIYLNKPVFYYVVGGSSLGVAYEELANESEVVTDLLLNGGAYNFANGLIQNQIDAMERRIDLSNQYLYRYVFVPRIGDHETVFSGANNPNSFQLLTAYPEDQISSTPVMQPDVEIAGPNGEYISGFDVDFSDAKRFTAATRWTNDTYGNGDYTWELFDGTGSVNSDGSFTVTSITADFATLIVTNNLISDSAIVFIDNN